MQEKRRPAREAWQRLAVGLKRLLVPEVSEEGDVVAESELHQLNRERGLQHLGLVEDGWVLQESVFLLSTPGLTRELDSLAGQVDPLRMLNARLLAAMKQGGEDKVRGMLGLPMDWLEKAREELWELGRELEAAIEQALKVPGPRQEQEPPTDSLFFGGGLSPSLRRRPEAL